MIGIVTGRCIKSGSGEYGPWYVIAEANTKKDGGKYDVHYMCGGNDAVLEGETVTVQGSARAKLDDRNGKHYANITLSFCSVTRHSAPEIEPQAEGETFEEDIPF